MLSHLSLAESTIQTLSQVALHFIWQGFALWLATACVLHVFSIRTSQARYAVCCGMMLLLAAAPLATIVVTAPSTLAARPVAISPIPLKSVDVNRSPVERAPLGEPASRLRDVPASTVPVVSRIEALKAWLRDLRPLVVFAWIAGITVMTVRLLLGTVGLWTIVRRRQPIPHETQKIAERLARQLAFRVCPAVHAVDRISQAMAVGILKPMILLPAVWISELPADVLEAVIAHELAHLRRWDVAINWIQRVVESVLFFHPAVWWCSRRMRIEREMCCDELAQAAIGNRVTYAKALSFLAHRQHSWAEPLLAAGMGGSKMLLLARIRNVLGLNPGTHGRFYGITCAAIGAIVASIACVALVGGPNRQRAKPSPVRMGAAPAPEVASVVISNVINAPSEKEKATLPNYRIEPPDVLLIEVMKVVPKPPYHVEATDMLSVQVEGTSSFEGLDNHFDVDSSGRIDLGPRYGKVDVGGQTIDEATQTIAKFLQEVIAQPQVSVTLYQSAGMQPVSSEHLIQADGRVNLGTYGQVRVAGMTVEEAREAVEKHLSQYLEKPKVSLSIFAANSQVYYVIAEGLPGGDLLARFPITGSETVLDALTGVKGLSDLSHKQISIVRPRGDGTGSDAVLPVNWSQITKGAETSQNYQVFPGDRIFVSDQTKRQPNRK